MTDKQLLTVEQVASEFQLTSQTIRNWIKSGAPSAVKIGHVYRVRREDVPDRLGELSVVRMVASNRTEHAA